MSDCVNSVLRNGFEKFMAGAPASLGFRVAIQFFRRRIPVLDYGVKLPGKDGFVRFIYEASAEVRRAVSMVPGEGIRDPQLQREAFSCGGSCGGSHELQCTPIVPADLQW